MKRPEEKVDNKKFYDAIVEYREEKDIAEAAGSAIPRIPEYIGNCLYNIATRLTFHQWFISYSEVYKEEMVGDALEKCITYFDKFKYKEYNNPFSYFTQICYFAFQNRKKNERTNQYIKYKSYEREMISQDIAGYIEDNNLTSATMYDNIGEFIEKYEHDEEEKRRKRRKKIKDKKELENAEQDDRYINVPSSVDETAG